MISLSHLKRVSYSKYLFYKGKELLAHNVQINNALAILHFHDATETFLLVNADLIGYKAPDSFMVHWDESQKKGSPLPNKNELFRLNRLRVDFKHLGILPTHDDCMDSERSLDSFFSSVSKSILGVDFNSISLSDLVEHEKIKKHLKESEYHLSENRFSESISESSKAFAYVLKEAEGDPWYSFLHRASSDLRDIEPRLYHSSSNYEIDKNFQSINKSLSVVKNQLEKIINEFNITLLGIDNYNYKRFKLLTPPCQIFMDGHVEECGMASVYHCKCNMNPHNATFCFNFVLDAALKLQEGSLDLINPTSPKEVKVIIDTALIYSHEENKLIEIGRAAKGTVFVSHGFPDPFANNKLYRHIDFNGKSAVIEAKDVEPYR